MRKDIVGDWGSDLSDTEYGQALAALGALEATGTEQHQATDDPKKIMALLLREFLGGDRTVIWRRAHNIDGATQKSWRETIHENAQALAEGWQLLLKQSANHQRRRPRLAVKAGWLRRPDLFDFNALMGWLKAPDTGCQALVLMPEDALELECRTLWHWPLRVGVPAGADGGPILDRLRSIQNGWIERLAILQQVGDARDACDLLILPPGMAARLAEQPRLYLQASFIASLDGPVAWGAAGETSQARLRAKLGAAGIALVGKSLDLRLWYEGLMDELSHDLPVHAAVWRVGLDQTGIPPVLVGDPEALDRLRIAAIANQIDRKIGLMSALRPLLQRTKPTFDKYALAKAVTMRRRGGLEKKIRSRKYIAERVDRVPIAEEFVKKAADLEQKRVLRYIQAQAWRGDVERGSARALAPDRPSMLSVHIGASAEAFKYGPFPEDQIDFSTGPVTMNVQVEIDGAAVVTLEEESLRLPGMDWADLKDHIFHKLNKLIAPPEPRTSGQMPVGVANHSIRLPLAGDSTRAVFGLFPQPGIDQVTGRIAIIHQNRIVQTACLSAPVGELADAGPGITVAAEAIVHPRLDNLAERRKFDATLIAADDLGSRWRLTVNCDGVVQEVEVPDIEGVVKKIYTAVCEVTRRPEDTLAINSEIMKSVFRSLASQGRLLYDALSYKLGDKLDTSERFQLVCRGNAFFPLEYVYDGPRLKLNAEVCPNSAEAMRRGDCGTCKYKGSVNFLCPLHFWGISKVIERHGIVQTESGSTLVRSEERFQPSPTRKPFGPVRPVLFAASARAFDFDDGASWRQQLLQALTLLGGAPPTEAKTWDDWRARITDSQPKVLVLLPHTDTVELGIDVLGIETKELLAKDEIDDSLVGAWETVQLLLLLGCAAAQVTETFAPYPQIFSNHGADVIIAPLAPILGADRGAHRQADRRVTCRRTIAGAGSSLRRTYAGLEAGIVGRGPSWSIRPGGFWRC